MRSSITKLHAIANKTKRLIIGLMSGTSLDGLDIALCEIEGCGRETRVKILEFVTVSYTSDFKEEIKTVFAKKNTDLEKLCLLNPYIALQHAAYINQWLNKWKLRPSDIDLIASHGQTIYHAPKRLHQQEKFSNATLQIGDGDHLAVATGIITISDFRQKNIAAGGEGAPLAFYGDCLLFSHETEDRILLNIGGIANFTYLPAGKNSEQTICTDTGPGNTMMDAFIQQHFTDIYFDKNGAMAKKGKINEDLLAALHAHSFFNASFPKTTGPEIFNLNYLKEAIQKSNAYTASVADTMATLNMFSADTIATAIKKCSQNKTGIKIYVSGGGIHNPLLMEHLKNQLPGCSFHTTAELGINADAKEAVLFALLANECVAGDSDVFSPPLHAVSMGKISFPC